MRSNQRKFLFEWQSFVAAMGLMSRIPAHWISFGALNKEHHHRAQIWYPAVGLILGSVIVFLGLAAPSHWHEFLTAALILTLWTALTGALHIDGLADTADAWVGGMGNRKRTLDIMKDPTSGPIGVTTVVLCLVGKCALITQLLAQHQILPLMLVPMLARAWLLPLIANLPYARASHEEQPGGMANAISQGLPKCAALISFILVYVITLVVLVVGNNDLVTFVALILFSGFTCFLIYRQTKQRLGGYTGDILGASVELQELTLLFALALFIAD